DFQAAVSRAEVGISPDGRWAATTGFEYIPSRGAGVFSALQLWNLTVDEPPRQIQIPYAHELSHPQRLVFSSDSKWLVACRQNGSLGLVGLQPDNPSVELLDPKGEDPEPNESVPVFRSIRAVEISPDSRWLAVAGEASIHVWELRGDVRRENPRRIPRAD